MPMWLRFVKSGATPPRRDIGTPGALLVLNSSQTFLRPWWWGRCGNWSVVDISGGSVLLSVVVAVLGAIALILEPQWSWRCIFLESESRHWILSFWFNYKPLCFVLEDSCQVDLVRLLNPTFFYKMFNQKKKKKVNPFGDSILLMHRWFLTTCQKKLSTL